MKNKVVKFGGSSLASAEQFKQVGEIHSDDSRRYVVPSAPGKRYSDDIKVTDMLYDCYRAAANGENFDKKMMRIKARYQEIIDGLNLNLSLENEFAVISEDFKKQMVALYI